MKTIKIGFSDFWGELIPNDNYFYHLLSMKYNVIIDNNNPDILFYTVYSNNHLKYDMSKTIKILYTGENRRPNYNECHYSLSFDYSGDSRNYRLPLWALILNWFEQPYRQERDHAYLHSVNDFLNKPIIEKSKFCSFVASNPAGKRLQFVPKLVKYKKVDCPGRVYNNMTPIGGRGDTIEKVKFLEPYKFNVAFENSSNPGYCTEKIIHSMFTNTIPIYWGDPLVGSDFNENSFINVHKFSSDEDVIEYIKEVDNNDELYKSILNEPWFKNNQIPEFVKPENVLSFFEKIID